MMAFGPVFGSAFLLIAGVSLWIGHFGIGSEIKGLGVRVAGLEAFDFFAVFSFVLGTACVIGGALMRRRVARERPVVTKERQSPSSQA